MKLKEFYNKLQRGTALEIAMFPDLLITCPVLDDNGKSVPKSLLTSNVLKMEPVDAHTIRVHVPKMKPE